MFKSKESIIGWVLIAVLMVGLVMYQTKKSNEERAKKLAEEKAAAANKPAPVPVAPDTAHIAAVVDSLGQPLATPGTPADTAASRQQYGAFALASNGTEQLYTLENDSLKVVFTTKGAQIKSIELKKFKTWDKQPLILFTDKTNQFGFSIPIEENKWINTRDFYFEADSTAGQKGQTIAFRLKAANGGYFEQRYSLIGNGYLFDYNVSAVGLGKIVTSNVQYITGNWENQMQRLEKDLSYERRYSALYYKPGSGDVDHLSDTHESDTLHLVAPPEWVSFKQQFFNTMLFSNGNIQQGSTLESTFKNTETNYVKNYALSFTVPFDRTKDSVSYAFQYYVGPNDYHILKTLHRDAEDIIKLGPDWFVFSWIKYITRFIIWIFNIFDKLHLNYGLIILLMTLILKLALHPLMAKSIESSAKMKILAPELNALKEKYGDDQARMSQEQMKLYNRAGVNMFGGCLPLLLQMPILIAMYNFFPASIELRQQAFLWAPDLSTYDSVLTWSKPILGQSHLSLFTVLMTLSSILQAVMNSQMNSMNNQQPALKYMPYFMPVMLMFIFNSFPAALTYYYLLQNLLGVGHQFVIQKFVLNEEKLRQQIEENKKNPKKKTGIMARIEAMQKQQQEQMRTRSKK